ncbi:protein rapunzel-like [Hemitrygon akajei]|uniref:protein rapunzel-like n=1 Tax=Hemitrygon akajei TaxID=2704970 RepID=UPI003BF961D7
MSQTAVDSIELTKSAVEAVQAAMPFIESAEKLASALGVFGPLLSIAASIVKLALGNVDSPELAYMKEQFQIVRNKLDVISDQINDVLLAFRRSTMDSQYFPIEENIKNQFRKYMDILSTGPQYRQFEKEEFLKHFDASKGDQNLNTLYDAVMGYSTIFSKPILDTVMSCDQRNRRLMEEFCARLKSLFCIGLIALLGHAAITGNDVKTLEKQWNEKLSKVEEKMKSIIDRCINEFAEQAKIDIERMVKEKEGRDNKQCSSYVLENLEKKYDWVRWSVRVYDPVGGFDNHCIVGSNFIAFFRLNNVNIVVSYSTDPKAVDERLVRQLMEGKDHLNDARDVAVYICKNLPGTGHGVHAVRRYKGLWGSWNFPTECHFWENYSGVTLSVHRT